MCLLVFLQGGLLSQLLQCLGNQNDLTSNSAGETLIDMLSLFVFEGSADDKVQFQKHLYMIDLS